jgi:DNA-nicking Smr family endonuclease
MKKSKTREQRPADFNNNPFKSLKGLKPAAAPAQGRKSAAPARAEKSGDDTALFLRSVQGVKSINPPSEAQPEAVKHNVAEKLRSTDQDEQQLFLKAMQKIGTAFPDARHEPEADEPPRRSASSRMRQLKRGTIRINEELDLHGHSKDEALVKLAHFITAAYSRGQKAVLVITGKGINSPEGPVLQGAAAAWLREHGKGIVAEFSPAPRDLGGSGAFVVFLKSR